MSYGQRFRELRKQAVLTQETVAKALGYERAAPVSLLERRNTKVPRPATIAKHAKALGCEPWELLIGVPTPHDRLRSATPLTDEALGTLLVGWARLQPPQLTAVLNQMRTFLAAPPLDVTAIATPPRDLARVVRAHGSHRSSRR